MSVMAKRKESHIEAVLSGLANAREVSAGLEDLRFEHCALPELDIADIDLSRRFLGKTLRQPFLIRSTTGGHAQAAKNSAVLAEAAQALGYAADSKRVDCNRFPKLAPGLVQRVGQKGLIWNGAGRLP